MLFISIQYLTCKTYSLNAKEFVTKERSLECVFLALCFRAAQNYSNGIKCSCFISISEPPGPPGKPQLLPDSPSLDRDVFTIRWEPPEYDGGSPVLGNQIVSSSI
jgi:hypothetical protein